MTPPLPPPHSFFLLHFLGAEALSSDIFFKKNVSASFFPLITSILLTTLRTKRVVRVAGDTAELCFEVDRAKSSDNVASTLPELSAAGHSGHAQRSR